MDLALEGSEGQIKRVRLSDAERARAVGLLGEARGQGRLDQDEFSDRAGRVYAAKTADDLMPLLDDLRVAGHYDAPKPHAGRSSAGASSERRVSFRAGDSTMSFAPRSVYAMPSIQMPFIRSPWKPIELASPVGGTADYWKRRALHAEGLLAKLVAAQRRMQATKPTGTAKRQVALSNRAVRERDAAGERKRLHGQMDAAGMGL